MERKLASVQKVADVQPIEGADKIEVATILGWKVVVLKGDFRPGDLCVYCEIDSVLPDKPEFEFLRPKKFRVKTIKLKGQISQGIAFPMSILPPHPEPYNEYMVGDDVTEIMGVTKFEIPIPTHLSGEIKGAFPGIVPKTDETRIQSAPGLLEEIKGLPVYITQKVDGTSATFLKYDGEVLVCSRNVNLKESEGNAYWKVYRDNPGLQKAVEEAVYPVMGGPLAIQGEVAGPGIQGNPMGLKELKLFVFNVYSIAEHKYLNFDEVVAFCKVYGLDMVPILLTTTPFDFTLEQLLEMAKGKYPSGKNQEGIVIRPMVEKVSKALDYGRMSFKVVNNDYLLKDEQ
jgi:RNA ligase (TIGR02306 family)